MHFSSGHDGPNLGSKAELQTYPILQVFKKIPSTNFIILETQYITNFSFNILSSKAVQNSWLPNLAKIDQSWSQGSEENLILEEAPVRGSVL